jgi:hypothetical protein
MNFSNVSQVVSVGSVDGVCTSAALLRLIGGGNIGLQFTQAFTVDKVDISKWPAGQKVALVDLAVNNRDKAMTTAFVRRIREAGHEIVAVIDEHSREDWLEVLGTFDGLAVEPQSQSAGTFKSSGAVLKAAVGAEADDHAVELMDAADAGDRMDFTTRFGGIVNQAVKSHIGDDARRVYLARHFAQSTESDATIFGWIAEYEEILGNHREIVAAKVDLGDSIVRVVATGKKVDMTTLMSGLYRGGAKVVVLEGEQYNKAAGCKMPMVSFGASDQKLDLLTPVKAAVPSASGFTGKVNVDPQHEDVALKAVRALLRK